MGKKALILRGSLLVMENLSLRIHLGLGDHTFLTKVFPINATLGTGELIRTPFGLGKKPFSC